MTDDADPTQIAPLPESNADTVHTATPDVDTAYVPPVDVPDDQAQAWSEDIEPEGPSHRRGWWLTAAVAAAIVAIAGIVAGGIGFGGWGLEQHRAATTTGSLPQEPSNPSPDGAYHLVANLANRQYFGGASPDKWAPDVDYLDYYTTYTKSCTPPGDCVLTSVSDGLPVIRSEYHFTDGRWVKEPKTQNFPDGATSRVEATLTPADGGVWNVEIRQTLTGATVVPDGGGAVVHAVLTPLPPGHFLPGSVLPPGAPLEGEYIATMDSSKATYQGPATWDDDKKDTTGHLSFATDCDGIACTATWNTNGGGLVMTLRWQGGAWVGTHADSAEVEESGAVGSATTTITYTPDGKGGFTGTFVELITSGPAAGSNATYPLTLTPN